VAPPEASTFRIKEAATDFSAGISSCTDIDEAEFTNEFPQWRCLFPVMT